MATNAETIAELKTQLATVEASIKQIIENGQSWRKGSSTSGFSVDMASLPVLRAERSELKSKIAIREAFEA